MTHGATTNDWWLYFWQSRPIVMEGYRLTSEPISLAEYERALSAAAGGPVTTTAGRYVGNPRDYYWREVRLVASRGDRARIELRLQESAFSLDDPSPILGDRISVGVCAPQAPYAARLAMWHAIRDELAKIGCLDRTADTLPEAIVDEARAAGDLETATRLEAEIAAVRAARARDRARAGPEVAPPPPEPVAAASARDAADLAPSTPTPEPPRPRALAGRLEPRVTFERGVLTVLAATVDPAALRVMIERGTYRDATKLVLAYTPLGDEGIALLAGSGGFPLATELDLGETGITDRGARALAREAVGLDHLAWICLGEVPAESPDIGARDGSGVSDAAVEELARSPRLPALRTISRSKEYRFVREGREGRELVAIRRADGRIVESWIDHVIWP